MKIHKNDIVKILKGKDRGKTGKVIKADLKSRKLIVDGLNLYKKHMRPKKQGEKGEVVKISRPITVSNLMLVCPNCKQSARVGYRFEKDIKFRYCKKCQSRI
ncbi:50S ribosomal protein L24 [Candidatus Jorgensenbacteria bacterium RIFCSPLOWO2_12_FULL_42_11]|uniref:Large ribosomal subunit protein uL24 n=1 Tax=Candidatus Jorgensenbacteria bacterium RIFCSPLOWO2_12_FULL_42_11 TaxID=1798473 RepID=A0A1F6C416_9BACT|nr:MAG: 50S ribosomal protein L24 [Candidatus Jorgensenbacteria bacterium RIFCSPLOWO2_12_FULL_42_11]